MRRALLSFASCVAFVSSSFAQVGQEPGEAQSKQVATRPAITAFTHPAHETRGVWLPASDMFPANDVDPAKSATAAREKLMAKLDQLKAAGFDRVLIDTQFRGYVLYPDSDVLPAFPGMKGADVLRELVDAVHSRGMKADAYMEYGFYAYFTPDKGDKSMGKLLDADPSMLSVDKNGEGKIARTFGTFYSLDPAHPHAVAALAKLNAEVAARYDVDSISLDRLRYADFDHMSLESRARFEKETGVKWAAYDIKSAEGQKLSEWKRQQNLTAVREICAAVRKAKPGLPITSYVVPPDEMMNKSQSYDLWMKEDLLDGIAVSMYAADITADAKKAIALLDGKTGKLIAALDTDKKTKTTAQFLTNVEVSRRMGMIGQFAWYSGSIDDADAQGLKAGPYSVPAQDPIAEKK